MYKSKPKPPLTDQSLWLMPVALISPNSHPVLTYVHQRCARAQAATTHRMKTVAAALSNGLADELTFPWCSLSRAHLSAIRDWLAQHYKPITVERAMCEVRGVVKECWINGLITADEYRSIVDTMVGHNHPVTFRERRVLNVSEKLTFILFCKHYQKNRNVCLRDAVVFGLGCFAGLTRHEMCNLTVDSYRPDESALLVTNRKGKERLIPLPPGLKRKIGEWLDTRGSDPGPLINGIMKYGKIMKDRRLTEYALQLALRRRAKQAGVALFSVFDLRSTFVANMIDVGADLVAVQEILGIQRDKGAARDRYSWLALQRAMALVPDLFINESENPGLYNGEMEGHTERRILPPTYPPQCGEIVSVDFVTM